MLRVRVQAEGRGGATSVEWTGEGKLMLIWGEIGICLLILLSLIGPGSRAGLRLALTDFLFYLLLCRSRITTPSTLLGFAQGGILKIIELPLLTPLPLLHWCLRLGGGAVCLGVLTPACGGWL